jgi:hypothetical protein
MNTNTKDTKRSSDLTRSLTSLVCGGTAGLVAKTVVAPFDRVKILFQVLTEIVYMYTDNNLIFFDRLQTKIFNYVNCLR